MIQWLFTALLCLQISLQAQECSILFVHIGKTLPQHLSAALEQARLFNPTCPIILIANEEALQGFHSAASITTVTCESLPRTKEHAQFLQHTKLNAFNFDGYWRHTSERFLYIYDYMAATEIEHVFHIENDVMLYADITVMLPLFKKFYPLLAAPFENKRKCIPSFVYISGNSAMQKLASYFAATAHQSLNDMRVLANFRTKNPEAIGCLPLIMQPLAATANHDICTHLEDFASLFDGAAIGIYLDGTEPHKGNLIPGFPSNSLFDPSALDYIWIPDDQQRLVPYALYKDKCYRINNLHIASKKLEAFKSNSIEKAPIELRSFVESKSVVERQLQLMGASHKGSYAFTDHIYITPNTRMNEGYIRIREYYTSAWQHKRFVLQQKLKYPNTERHRTSFRIETDTFEEAVRSLPEYAIHDFSFSRTGDEYHLEDMKIFVETIENLPLSIEILSDNRYAIEKLLQALGGSKPLEISVPEYLQLRLRNLAPANEH